MDRRQFVGSTGAKVAQGTAAAACAGLLWHALIQQQARAAAPLRPPGAKEGGDFAAACIKCGQCVVSCPPKALKLRTASEPGVAGTPGFTPRDGPCVMCEDIPCARVCPSGALDAKLPDIRQARMGLAVIDAEHCLSWQGLRCEVCFRVCPIRGEAITIAPQQRLTSKHAVFVPLVHAEKCTGCGVCEKHCPAELASIRVIDPRLVQGRIGAHYRLSEPRP